ncbi:MAG: phosphoesterase, partial [Gemmata sp.]
MPLDEKVLVIPTARFRAAGYFHGLQVADAGFRAAVLDPAAFSFRPRYEVETDPEFKQLIPYIVLKCGERVFHYRRGAAGTEKRLEA